MELSEIQPNLEFSNYQQKLIKEIIFKFTDFYGKIKKNELNAFEDAMKSIEQNSAFNMKNVKVAGVIGPIEKMDDLNLLMKYNANFEHLILR